MANPDNTRFTLMALPQHFDGDKTLHIHLVFIPRNINPLINVEVPFATAGALTPFADVQPQFEIMVVKDPNEFAGKIPANEVAVTPDFLNYSTDIRKIYETLKNATDEGGKPKYFDIDEDRSAGRAGVQKAPIAIKQEDAVKKYLPESYRQAFNFTSPRTPNARTDDSYHCAIRDEAAPQVFVKDDKVSWGKVYAYLLRQPLMAEKAGLIYKTTVTINVDDYKNGGWIYARIKDGTKYSQESKDAAAAGEQFIKSYAARIPPLKAEEKSLFAAILFPVMGVGEDAAGDFDELYIEASRYNDGFSKITHANQPVSHNLLKEQQDGFHPQKEVGIRLGWEDEQILIWYLRQMAIDEKTGVRLDAPLGVTGYHIDVAKVEVPGTWESLTAVQSNGGLMLEDIDIGAFDGELPFGVYPVKLYGKNSSDFWLPMYFSNWNDTSLVLPDKTAADIYANEEEKNKPVVVTDTYRPIANTIKLEYGKSFLFRVRMTDISGGGPLPTFPTPKAVEASGIAHAAFKRYIAPNALRISGDEEIIKSTDDVNFNGNNLTIQRPLLGFPSVVYTRKYADPIPLLKAAVAKSMDDKTAFGIADPDVAKVEIKVEVETLQMDNLASDTGKENYITLFKTYRNFDKVNFDAALQFGIVYKDMPVLQLDKELFPDPYVVPADNDFITATEGDIILPTSRNLRITMRAVCEGEADYWGNNSLQPDLNSRFGKPTIIKVRRAAQREDDLFNNLSAPQLIQGIYLQPDPIPEHKNKLEVIKIGDDHIPNIVERLAKQLDVDCNGLTLMAKKGQRIQFGCSNHIRHTLAPDNSSITFANKNELLHHWLVTVSLNIDRDWAWDGLEDRSFIIERQHQFAFENKLFDDADPSKVITRETIGDIELRRIAPYQAIQQGNDGMIHREKTGIIFIDALDPKPFGNNGPDTLAARYTIKPQFRKKEDGDLPAGISDFTTAVLQLPTTINPYSIPKLIGAGIALSPYVRNIKYSTTEARKRYLWLEFEKTPDDKRDALFARVLAYAPDQLLSNNHPSLYGIDEEPPLPIDPEYIRVITTDAAHNHPGLNAMQKMEKSTETDRHFYILPLPPGMHNESVELFGFFTYEFRFGHSDQLWSTAQGRFGRALRVSGLQHPAPTLYCTVNRDDKNLKVSAPFATTVFNGRNVTSDPPRTSLWALLYAQVKQADGLDYRNILLDEKQLHQPDMGIIRERLVQEFKEREISAGIEFETAFHMHEALQKEAPRYGETVWTNTEIIEILELYGLPGDASLSVLCVETFGQITNIKEHINDFDTVQNKVVQSLSLEYGKEQEQRITAMVRRGKEAQLKDNSDRPLSNELGKYRIVRTSPLVEVPFVCCTEC